MKVIRDPKGNALKLVLLQVLDRDEQGPLTLRCRRDHESIDLAGQDSRDLKFWVAWVCEDDVLGELQITDVYREMEAAKQDLDKATSEIIEAKQQLNTFSRELAKLQLADVAKTEELRKLQRERDPARFDASVAAAVELQTAKLESNIHSLRKMLADSQREVEELRVSKRKLKEANDRLKEGRK